MLNEQEIAEIEERFDMAIQKMPSPYIKGVVYDARKILANCAELKTELNEWKSSVLELHKSVYSINMLKKSLTKSGWSLCPNAAACRLKTMRSKGQQGSIP